MLAGVLPESLTGAGPAHAGGQGAARRGGSIPVNTGGCMLARGHPLGAGGVAQSNELVTQLRGEAGRRQVEGARTGLAYNAGVMSCCVTILSS